jgi:hypothetical protein
MFASIAAKILGLSACVLVAWSVAAGASGAHGPRTVYRVQPHDSLWSIAASHYSGDPAASVWAIKSANKLGDSALYPGETLILP